MPGNVAGTEGKAVRLSFVVDEQSLQRARQAISALISDTQKLGEMLSRTKLGSLGGGGGGSLLAGGAVQGGGPGQQSQQQLLGTTKIQSPALSIGSQLTQNLSQQRTLLQDLARGSSDAMRMMSDTLSRAIDQEKRALKDLQSELKNVTDGYNEVSDAAKGMGAGQASSLKDKFAGEAVSVQSRVNESKARLEQLSDQKKQLEPVPQGLDDPKRSSGLSALTQKRSMSGMGAGLGIGAIGIGALLGGAGALANDVVNAPMRYSGAAAQRAQVWSPYYQRAVGGDFTDVMAMRGIQSDRQERQDFADITGSGRNALQRGQAGIGGFLKMAAGSVTGMFGGSGPGMTDVMNQVAGPGFETERMKEQAQKMEEWKQAHFVQVMGAEAFMSGAQGNLQAGRALGIGWKRDQSGNYVGGGMMNFANKLARGGYDTGQYMGAFSGIQSTGGRLAAQSGGLTYNAMAAQASGMGNAAQIAGMASLGGGASGFMSQVYGLGYGGGRDTAAAGMLGGAVAGGIGSAGIYSSGMGALNAFGSFMGGSGTEQMISARRAQAGLGAMGGITGGSFDAYQRGLNLVNAKGAGVRGVGAMDYLSRMSDPRVIMDMMGGEISPEMKALGITKGQGQAYAKSALMSPLSRIMGGAFDPNSGVAQTASSLQGAFGRGETGQQWLTEQEAAEHKRLGKKFNKGAFDRQKATELGMGLSATMGISADEGIGMAQAMLGAGAKGGKGRGPGGVGGPEAEYLKNKADAFGKVIDAVKGNLNEYLESAKQLPSAAETFANAGQNLGLDAKDLAANFSKLSNATQELIFVMKGGNMADVQKFRSKFQKEASNDRAGAMTAEARVLKAEASLGHDVGAQALAFKDAFGTDYTNIK